MMDAPVVFIKDIFCILLIISRKKPKITVSSFFSIRQRWIFVFSLSFGVAMVSRFPSCISSQFIRAADTMVN